MKCEFLQELLVMREQDAGLSGHCEALWTPVGAIRVLNIHLSPPGLANYY
jgi:hypothetical protein